MTLTEDPSRPPTVTGTGTGNLTTAAFSPPANTLLVALTSGEWGSTKPVGATVTDSGGHTWTARATAAGTAANGGVAKIYTTYLSSAATNITVTAAFTNLSGGRFLDVRVLTGAVSDQSSAATATRLVSTASTDGTISITPTTTGSRVYGISDDPDTNAAYTVNAFTTALTDHNNTTDSTRAVSWRSTNDTGSLDVGSPATFGGNWASAQRSNIAAIEVIPATSTTHAGAASLAGAATLGGPAMLGAAATATLPGAAGLTAGAALGAQAAATMASTGTLAADATRVQPAAASMAGAASLTSGAALGAGAAVTMTAVGTFTGIGQLTEPATATLIAMGSLTGAGVRVLPAAATLAGDAALTAAGVAGTGATLTAQASLTVTATQTAAAEALLIGLATLGGPAWAAQYATVTLAGTAGLAASLSIPATAGLVAAAALTAAGVTLAAATATLVAQSGLTVAARVTVTVVATLPAVGALTAGPHRIAGGTGALLAAATTIRANPTITTPGQVLAVSWWALNPDGTYLTALPDVVSWQLSLVDGSPGAVTLDYPVNGARFDVLRDSVTSDRDLLIAIWVAGKDLGSLRAILNTAEGDDVAESTVWRFSGNLTNVRMEEALVAPRTTVVTPPTGPAPTEDLAALRVYSVTAGTLMATLMQEAHGRGALSDVTYSFSATVDSQGAPWSKTITLKIAPGTSYIEVLTALVEAAMCEWEVIDHELVLWEPGTRGTDHTATIPPIILRAGDTLTSSPRKHTVRDAGTTLTVAGGEGFYTTVSDPTALARRGRRIEQYRSQGSLTDPGSLSAYATAKLPAVTAGAMEVAHGLALVGAGPEPLIAYRVGDWVWSDTGHGLERLRVRQLTIACDQHGVVTAGVSLNDLIADQIEALSRRLAGIEGGTTITGTSNAAPVIPDAPDTVPPAAPQGVAVDSLAQPSPELVPRSAVTAAWATVTLNADGTAISDLAGYTVQWRYLDPALVTNWRQLAPVTATSADWADVVAGEPIEVRVAAFDATGNTSTWSDSAFHTTQTDLTPPPVPSTPVVSEFLGTLTVTWDGRGSAGEAMPSDFQGVQVHRSTITGFTPSASTFAESMLGPGSRNYPDLPLGVTQYFRLISYDRAGNLSGASAQASAVPAPVGMGDIAFTDPGNLVEDGSFELSTSRATHAARSDPAWSFVSGGADHGTWFARGSGAIGSGLRALVLSPPIPTTPGSDYAIRWAMRATSVNGDMSMRIRWALPGTTTDTTVTFTPGFSTAWTNTERGAGTFTAPAGAVGFQIMVVVHADCTAGTWDVDRVEARETIGTLLVRDLAVTDAQIASAGVGKLIAGTITAVMLMAGLLRSGVSGLRYVLDANGLRFYDSTNNLVIDLNRAGAAALLTGTLQTGVAGRRVVVSGPGNEIRFYPQSGETRYGKIFSYIPGNFPNDIAIEQRAIDSDSADYTARSFLLPDAAGVVVSPQGAGGDTVYTGAVQIGTTYATLSYAAVTGSPPYDLFDLDLRGQVVADNTGVTLAAYTSGATDGGYLYLTRGGGPVYVGKRTGGSDNYLRFSGNSIEHVISGSYVLTTDSGGTIIYAATYSPRYAGLGGGRCQIRADDGADVFFFWSGGQLWIGSGSSAVKTFVIDHPVKPDRYLVHSTTESPHAGVEYWGVATVEDGEAVVMLPDYFEALTEVEGRVVLLTVIAETDPAERLRLPRRRPRQHRAPPPRVTRRIPRLGETAPEGPVSGAPLGAPPTSHRPASPPQEFMEVTDPPIPATPMGLPPQVQATVPENGRFTIYATGPVDTFRVSWLVKAIRRSAQFDTEPLKARGDVRGDGPYRFYVPR